MFRTYLPFVHMYVFVRARAYVSSLPLVIIFRRCLLSLVRESKRKQEITRSEFFHIFVYRFSSLLLLLLSYLLSLPLETPDKRSL